MAKTPNPPRVRRGKVIALTPDEQVEQATLERHVVAQEAAEKTGETRRNPEKSENTPENAEAPAVSIEPAESPYQARQRRLKELRRG